MAFPGDVYVKNCSARDALELISGKWVMLILPALARQPMRNGELLRQLERNGLIERRELRAKPVPVEYRLTAVACSLVDTLVALDRWAEHTFPELDAARARYDCARSP